MATKYRTDLGNAPEPAMANPATMQKAILTGAEATAKTIGVIGGAIWEGYKGYEEASLTKDLDSEVAKISGEMAALKKADVTNKAMREEDIAALPRAVDGFRAASILANADPDEAKTLAGVFGKQTEDASVARFREEQQRIMAARDAMPERQHEFMQRSEQILRKYISQMPGMANNFRQIAAQVTGKEHLDLYSVNRLYSDIDYVEKQRIQAAKNAEAANQQLMSAYVDDRVKGGVSKTQAMAEFNTVTPEQRMELAQASVAASQAADQSKEALKLGGNALLNMATLAQSQFEGNLLSGNAYIYAQLQQMGVSRQQIASGTIPEGVLNSPEYKKLIDEGGTKILNLLDLQYKEYNEALQAKLRTNPADAGDAKQALSELRSWYDDRRKYYSENKTSWLVATSSQGDGEQILQRRLTLVDTFVRSLGLPPEVVANLGMTGDSKGYTDAKARYPKAATAIDYANELRRKAMQGVSQQEWLDVTKKVDVYNTGDLTIPTDKKGNLAALTSHSQLAEKVKKAALEGPTPTTPQDAVDLVRSSFISPANAEQFMSRNMTSYDVVASKIPASEQGAAKAQITQAAVQNIYGEVGHGNAAKRAYNDFATSIPSVPGTGSSSTAFADPTGNGPLRIVVNRKPREGLTTQEKLQFDRYNRVAVQPTSVNRVLSDVDTMLRIQARTTNTPIEKLRKEFIDSFLPEGRVSDNYTAKFAKAAVEATTQPTAPAGKVASMSDVVRFAAEKKVSVDEAVAGLKAQGYTVGE